MARPNKHKARHVKWAIRLAQEWAHDDATLPQGSSLEEEDAEYVRKWHPDYRDKRQSPQLCSPSTGERLRETERRMEQPVTRADIEDVEARFLRMLGEAEPGHPWTKKLGEGNVP